jgi:hypothetical protein
MVSDGCDSAVYCWPDSFAYFLHLAGRTCHSAEPEANLCEEFTHQDTSCGTSGLKLEAYCWTRKIPLIQFLDSSAIQPYRSTCWY